MDNSFTRRVQAAAAAGWWAILILALWMIVAWILVVVLLSKEPQWVLKLLGGQMTWPTLRTVYVWGFAAMKLMLWAFLTVVIWLTLWGRRLRKAD